MNGTWPGQTAICAVHAGQRATEVCQRCGNFMCDACSENRSSPYCPRCREISGTTAFPFTRDNWSVDGLMGHCWDRFKQEWLMLSLSVLVLLGIVVGVSLFGQVFGRGAAATESAAASVVVAVLFNIVQTLVQGALQLGLIRVGLDVLHGRKAEVGRMFSQFSKIWKYILQTMVIGLVIVVPLVLYSGLLFGIVHLTGGVRGDARTIAIFVVGAIPAVVALVWVSLGLMFAQTELVYDDAVDAIGALGRSWEMAKGKRLPLFGMSLLVGLIAMAGLIACCVGVLASMAFAQLVFVGLFLTMRSGVFDRTSAQLRS